jgi:hypothetical protein
MKTAIAVACACLTAVTALSQDMIAVGYARYVYALDSSTGVCDLIGIGMLGQAGLARDGAGTIWTTGQTNSAGGPTYYLVRVEPSNGQVTPMFVTQGFRSLASAPGNSLFGLVNGTPADLLASIDTTTGQSTTVGSTGLTNLVALVVHQGQLYAWDTIVGLVTVDPLTGLATDVNPAAGGSDVTWLSVREDGTLIGGGALLFTIDPATGVTTYVVTTNGINITGVVASGTFTRIGTGCAGGRGNVSITVSGALRTGTVLGSTSVGHGYGTGTTLYAGVLILGLSSTSYLGQPLPIDLGPVLGTQDCSLQTSIDSTQYGVTSLGVLQFLLPLPPSTGGTTFFLQHAVFEPVPGGMSWSGAARVHVGM